MYDAVISIVDLGFLTPIDVTLDRQRDPTARDQPFMAKCVSIISDVNEQTGADLMMDSYQIPRNKNNFMVFDGYIHRYYLKYQFNHL